MIDLDVYRRCYAEEIEAVANLTTPALIEALASVPRERFLPPGPWTVRSEADLQAPSRQTPDADPRRLYHNLAIAIDASRVLFNGAPSLVSMAIDALRVEPGARVLHVGTGTGYYTALLAHCAGPRGRVLGCEVDEALAARATANLAEWPWVEVKQGDSTDLVDETFDAILVNAGVTHIHDGWMERLAVGGRLMVPLTATMPAMGPIGKGPMVLATRGTTDDSWDARLVTFVAIYSAVGLRDDELNVRLGAALRASPFPPIRHLRRDPHAEGPACWLHARGICLSTA